MKRILLTTCLFVLLIPIYAQTLVSTSPENKNAILEEFTGINCVFCPQGHAIANAIKANNPDDFFVINVHVGGFATPGAGQPDFRTPFGTALDNQANVAGYPAGTVNRMVFPGFSQNPGGTAMGRNRWSSASTQTIQQPSYLNVGLEALIDVSTNELTVNVEVYYTGDSPVDTNKLNVALLQNNTLGPQVGGNMGNNYVHMHRLVHMLTGQWGVDINTTTEGSFVTETFTYTIPDDYNGVPANIFESDFEVVAFVAEGQQNIISGKGTFAELSGLLNNDVRISSIEELSDICSGSIFPKVVIQNRGLNPINSLDIEYSVNGQNTQTYNWTGTLNSIESAEIELPGIGFDLQATNQLEISIPDDDNNDNNTNSLIVNAAESFDDDQFNLTITLDNYPQETTWEVRNSLGSVLYSGGPYPGQQGDTINESIMLSSEDCYSFTIFDDFGDGICCGFGNGSYSLEASNGDDVISGGDFDSQESKTFGNFGVLSTSAFDINDFKIFPNPSNGIVNIIGNDRFQYEIYTLQGKNILSGRSDAISQELNLADLSSGIYLIKLMVGTDSKTQKLIIK
jgi:hypothetical protein